MKYFNKENRNIRAIARLFKRFGAGAERWSNAILDNLGISIPRDRLLTQGQQAAMDEINRRLGAPRLKLWAYRLLFPSYYRADKKTYQKLMQDWEFAYIREVKRQTDDAEARIEAALPFWRRLYRKLRGIK